MQGMIEPDSKLRPEKNLLSCSLQISLWFSAQCHGRVIKSKMNEYHTSCTIYLSPLIFILHLYTAYYA